MNNESHDINEIIAPLLATINTVKPIGTLLEEALLKSFNVKHERKGKLLLQEGDIDNKLWYLSKGVLRSFHEINERDVTSRIMYTGHIVISPGSFFTQTAATESIEALSDCTLAVLPYDMLQKIYINFPEFNYHTRIITEQYFYKQEQRLYMLRKHDADAKYDYFLQHYANFLSDIPQKFIASFLNIAPETLSRTRNKLRTK